MGVGTDVGSTFSRERPSSDAHRTRLAPYLSLVLQSHDLAARPVRICLDDCAELTVGRGATRRIDVVRDDDGRCAVHLQVVDPWMSQRHALLRRQGPTWQLEDGGSKNGSVVNGQSRDVVTLCDGDLLELGRTFFAFRLHVVPLAEISESDRVREADDGSPHATFHPEYARQLARLRVFAGTPLPILLQGETGTGKELVAHLAHELSRRAGALVPVNCGALPASLVESELFGYRKGAFSGASEDRPGLVRSAHEGTLFLDELAELPADAQVKLLRVLQEKQVQPVGATRPLPVDVRFVAATHGDLAGMVAAGTFRRDLLARLSGCEVRLPPLRERREDLGLLVRSILRRASAPALARLSIEPDAFRALAQHAWPQNIRELEHVLSAALAMSPGGAIGLAALPRELYQVPAEAGERTEAVPRDPVGSHGGAGGRDDDAQRARFEALCLRCRGNVSAIARELQTSRTQVHRLLGRYGLSLAAFR